MMVLLFGLIVVIERSTRTVGYRRKRAPNLSPSHRFDPAASSVLTGGLRNGWWNASWPFARLTVDTDWIQITAFMVPGTWIPRRDVKSVKQVRSMSSGLWFETIGGKYDGVIFWTFERARAEKTLASYGWPVRGAEPGWTCPSCSRLMPSDARYCAGCGGSKPA